MRAEIISIGDELTSGKILDTNSQWLSRELSDLGVQVLFHTTVGDDLQANIGVFRCAAARADIIIATGGLGPTADDLTRESLAEMLDVPLERNEKALQSIRALFTKRGREMPSMNEKQALIPRGGTAIPNPNGTAPGVDVTVSRIEGENRFRKIDESLFDRFRIIALPGVPAEMKEMWKETVHNELETFCQTLNGGKRVIRFRSIHSFGLGESQVEAMLPDLINRAHFPTVGITADQATITLRIKAEADSEEKCYAQIEPVAEVIREKLGKLVYGEDHETLADAVCDILKKEHKTLAVMEWGTRGLLADALSMPENAEDHFLGGLVVRSAKALRNTIRYSSELAQQQEIPADFSERTIESSPAINERIVSLMARHVLKVFDCDYSLTVGPYPFEGKDRVAVFVALGKKQRQTGRSEDEITILTESHAYGGHPAIIDALYTKRAMNLLRLDQFPE